MEQMQQNQTIRTLAICFNLTSEMTGMKIFADTLDRL